MVLTRVSLISDAEHLLVCLSASVYLLREVSVQVFCAPQLPVCLGLEPVSGGQPAALLARPWLPLPPAPRRRAGAR